MKRRKASLTKRVEESSLTASCWSGRMVYIRSGRALRGAIHLPHLTGKPLKSGEKVGISGNNKTAGSNGEAGKGRDNSLQRIPKKVENRGV